MKLFAMEKELRIIKNRGHFPVPTITPQGMKIETTQDKDKVLGTVDAEAVEMIIAVRGKRGELQKRTGRSLKQEPTIGANKANQRIRLQFPHNGQQHTNEKWPHTDGPASRTL